MKHHFLIILASLLGLVSCVEKIDTSDRYVFKEHTITSYLQGHEEYSEFCDVLFRVNISRISQSTVGQLLSARGHYTCFAPTNDAIHNYLQELTDKGLISAPSWDAFPDSVTLDSIRTVIVKNSIIDGGDLTSYETNSFPNENGEFELSNMNDRKLSVHYGSNPDSIYINSKYLIDLKNRDVQCINGVVHQMQSVVAPNDISLAGLLQECIDGKHTDYRVMAMLVKACGLLDTLDKKRDENYELAFLTGKVADYPANGLQSTPDGTCYVPEHRKYGFTLMAEPDAFWESTLGKSSEDITVDEVKQWVISQDFYPESTTDNDFSNTNNVLNQFVTYHLLPMRIPNNKLVFHNNENGYRPNTGTAYTIPVMEYYTTMGQPRLLKIYQSRETSRAQTSARSTGIYLNRFPELDNARQGTYHELSCDPEKEGNLISDCAENLSEYNVVNGIIYPIDGVLAYTDDVRSWMMKSRIRLDAMSFFPEVMNNDIRQNSNGASRNQVVAFPQDNIYKYLDNVSINADTRTFAYFCAYGWSWNNYQGDEIKAVGQYDYTFKLPPVPKRTTYEIRYKVLANSDRGVCQIYFGKNPNNLPIAGIPMDLTIGGVSRYTSAGEQPSIVGWQMDSSDDDQNAEWDKSMRNNGFMKGPNYYWDGEKTSRGQHWNVRRIIVRQTLDPNETYYLRFKSCIESATKEFYIDYIEYCAKEIYDNPMTPEDIW